MNSRFLLSSGSCLLNLACSGKPTGAYPVGSCVLIVGDSAAGKTWLALSAMAEAAQLKYFDDYELIHDDAEQGAQMNLERYFGKKAASRIRPAAVTRKGQPDPSTTIDQFYDRLDDLLDAGTKCIYAIDSQDVLSSGAEQKKVAQQKADREAGRDGKGAMTDGKAAIHSRRLRVVLPKLRKTGSILFILSQTRDNIGTFTFETKTRSGGRALRFYADLEFWLSIKSRIKKNVRGKPRKIGVLSKIQLKKNRLTGSEGEVVIPILRASGIDDVGSCVDFLVEERHWKSGKAGINADEFDFQGNREKLIRFVEAEGYEKDLHEIVGDIWKEIDAASQFARKSRYS